MSQGTRIRDLRKVLNMTMDQFGERIGVTKSTISNIENENRNATEHMLKSICREYGVREEWLRDGVGEPFGAQTLNQELLAWINRIMPEEDSSFKKRFAYALSKMSDDGWQLIEEFCNNLTKKDD